MRYRYFDQPLFEQARKQVYDQVEDHLAYLAANPDAADRHESVRALVECPQPLVSLFSGRFATRGLRHAQLDAGGDHLAVLPDSDSHRTSALCAIDGHCFAVGRIRS